jgi:hypothetical protein
VEQRRKIFSFAQCGNNLKLVLAITEITEIEKRRLNEILHEKGQSHGAKNALCLFRIPI